MLSEPDVALTDFGLTVECAGFVAWLYRRAPAGSPWRAWFMAFFSSIGVGALLGGVTHGFVADFSSPIAQALWSATLLALGLAALACWAIGARLLFSLSAARWIEAFAGMLFALYAAAILFVDASFVVAIAHYGLAGAFLLIAFVVSYYKHRRRCVRHGIGGLVLSYAAAAVQQTGTAIDSLNLSHNALYHIIQAIALALIFLTARGLAQGPACRRDASSP